MIDPMFEIVVTIAVAISAVAIGLGLPYVIIAARMRHWLLPAAVLTLSIVPLGSGGGDVTSDGSIVRQVGWGLTFLAALIVGLQRKSGYTRPKITWIPLSYAVLLTYAAISVAWSDQPFVSLKRVIQLFGVALIALAMVRNRGGKSALDQFLLPGGVLLLVGALALGAPALSLDSDGNYKGVGITKNLWAQLALLVCVVSWIGAYGARSRHAATLLVTLAVAIASLVFTRSATALMAFVSLVAVVMFWRGSKRIGGTAAAVGAIIATSSFALALIAQGKAVEAIATIFGKDATLTGRTALWQMLQSEIERHPWFGAGYGGFWIGSEGPSWTIVRALEWGPGQGHSGFIDLTNELGFVGLALLAIVLAIHAKKICTVYAQGLQQFAALHWAILAVCILLNVAETSFMRTTALWWVVLSISVIDVHVALLQQPGREAQCDAQ